MGLEGRVKPVSAYASEAKAAQTQEMLALLQLLAMARDDMNGGRVQPLDGLKQRIRTRAAQC